METKVKNDNEIFAHMLSREEIDALPGREMKEKRTGVGKLYDLGDGHYQAVLYPEPVHVQNAQGEWEEIDHTLTRKEKVLTDGSVLRGGNNVEIGIRLHDTRPGTLRERLGYAAAQGFSCVQLAMGKAVPGFKMAESLVLLTKDLAAEVAKNQFIRQR